jgi:hypothetical protein
MAAGWRQSLTILQELRDLASVDLYTAGRQEGAFVGRPFQLDFSILRMISNDKWKNSVGGLPAGAFLLCFYEGEPGIEEALLLRILRPTKLPTDDDVVASMVEYYKEAIPTDAANHRLDSYTRAEFQFSGLECRVLGTFYRNMDGVTQFAGDLDNFYAPNNYRVYKPTGKVLQYVVNFREGGIPGGKGEARIGEVRYSSSQRHAISGHVPVFISPTDFLGKRTALFGMTRTGKSNTLKKLIQATVDVSNSGVELNGNAIEPAGQIIFDVNGEYANDNQQDEGTALYHLFPEWVTRYSLLEKPGFKVMKLNFYQDIAEGFSLIQKQLADDTSIYTKNVLSVPWESPDPDDWSAVTRYDRRVACYQAILHQAGFVAPPGFTIRCKGGAAMNGWTGIDPSHGIAPDQAVTWFTEIYQRLDTDPFFQNYRLQKGKEWADEDLKALMRFLTRRSRPGGDVNEAGFRKLTPLRELHTPVQQATFLDEIVDLLRSGKIVIVDLSQGDPIIQRTYSNRICAYIFDDAMRRFIANESTNFIQLCFEEAHNLFPRKEDTDLTNIYNRLAKEGAKLGLGLLYATQEVSSISGNVLKNTQNWFVSHLNNREELREIQKYYDFEDFVESLLRTTDKGFIRMKTYSNTFVVPVQIDRFQATKG